MNARSIVLSPDDVVAATRAWIERAVIGLNLCPFAKAVYVKDQIRYAVSQAQNSGALLDDLERELRMLPAQVRDREYSRVLRLQDEEDAEREPAQNGPAYVRKDDGKASRARDGFEGIEFCLGPNDETRHLPTGAQALLDAVDDFLPGAGFVGSSAMCGKAVFEERLLPLVERHVVGGCRDAIPQRLHVVDLVFDWKRVEPRGRQRQGVRHGRNMPPDPGTRAGARWPVRVVYSADRDKH